MGQHEQAQRLTTGAAELGDAVQALCGAAATLEEANRNLSSDALRRVVTALHTQCGRLVGVSDALREVAELIEVPADPAGPLVPCRLISASGAPITDMNLPPASVGDLVQVGDNVPWRVMGVYRAILTVGCVQTRHGGLAG
jgi:hypothetical protein